VGSLSRIDPKVASRISGHAEIVAFRNLLIHGYDLIDDGRVWQVITDDVSTLEQQVEKLIEELTGK